MFWRKSAGYLPARETKNGPEVHSSNIKMLLIAAAFLVVTIGLILVQPGPDPLTEDQIVAQPQTSVQTETEAEVTRADASLLDISTVSASEAVSRQLRQPIRLTDTEARHTDLRGLTSAVLVGFGHTVTNEDRLQALLVQALTEGQSNAYIDALLNTAAARGEFNVPRQLTTSTGRLDTETLLTALIRQSKG